jgi:DNA transformation protein
MSAFVQSLHEIFAPLGRIETRRMFGGHGVWHDGRMIALVAGDTLYLKSDAESAAHFDRLDLPPFTYERRGQPTPTSYRQAPADLFEDREQAALWGRRAYEAALRSGHMPKAKARRATARKTTGAAKTRKKATPAAPAAKKASSR